MTGRVFVPHSDCTVANGDCFREGKCLRACRANARNRLEDRVEKLERLVEKLSLRLVKLEVPK